MIMEPTLPDAVVQNRILDIDATRKTNLFQKSLDFLTVLNRYNNVLHDNVKYKCNTCLRFIRSDGDTSASNVLQTGIHGYLTLSNNQKNIDFEGVAEDLNLRFKIKYLNSKLDSVTVTQAEESLTTVWSGSAKTPPLSPSIITSLSYITDRPFYLMTSGTWYCPDYAIQVIGGNGTYPRFICSFSNNSLYSDLEASFSGSNFSGWKSVSDAGSLGSMYAVSGTYKPTTSVNANSESSAASISITIPSPGSNKRIVPRFFSISDDSERLHMWCDLSTDNGVVFQTNVGAQKSVLVKTTNFTYTNGTLKFGWYVNDSFSSNMSTSTAACCESGETYPYSLFYSIESMNQPLS